MNSHELAQKLRDAAEDLAQRPVFEIPQYADPRISVSYYGDKEKFLAAVKALGSGKKVTSDYHVTFEHGMLHPFINRDAVCRKVQEEKWECEPLLTPEEDAELSASAS